MRIDEQRQGAVTVLRPEGQLVQEDADRFGEALHGAIERSLGRLVVDASAVPFVDSRGLEVLLDASEALARSGGSLRLCGTNETLREVMDLTGLSGQFEHHADVNSAVRSYL